MGGTQRLAERAGSGRARHFVMSGELFDAEDLQRAVKTFLDKGPGHAEFQGR